MLSPCLSSQYVRHPHIWRRKLQSALPLLLRPFRESIRKAIEKRHQPSVPTLRTLQLSLIFHALPPEGTTGALIVCIEMKKTDISENNAQFNFVTELLGSLISFFRSEYFVRRGSLFRDDIELCGQSSNRFISFS